MSKDIGMLAAVASAAGLDKDKAETVDVNAGFIKQHFGAVAAELIAEGKTAERDRIIGIEAAAMPGHEAIIKAHKADPSKSAADAALAVIAAENAVRGKHLEALKTDETSVKGLRSEPANGTEAEKPAGHGLVGEPKWKAEYGASEELQAEFKTEAKYLAFKNAEASGRVKILNKKSA